MFIFISRKVTANFIQLIKNAYFCLDTFLHNCPWFDVQLN